MGLIVGFSISLPPSVDGFRNDGLATTVIDVNVPHGLLVPIGHLHVRHLHRRNRALLVVINES